jgi:RsiW-degrading membrane proteinase PrsW (M82 family)
MIYIIRNEHVYGPYDEAVVARYVEDGKLLKHDKARDAFTGEESTVDDFLARRGLYPKVRAKGTLGEQLRAIGSEFIFPKEDMKSHQWMQDKRLLVLAIVGLSLSVLMTFPIGGYLVFYAISLYFAVIWGLFFYYFFRTRQVNIKTTVSVFFLTQLAVFLIFSGLNQLNFFYTFTKAAFPFNAIGFILGVGLTEEFVKMLPLLYLVHRAKEPLLPQTLVYYGLMSGIAFGVFEGVQYQTTINAQADYTTAFFLNIARLTSLPFLHALWGGICGYFVGFANLYPRYRKSLYVLALAIPAVLHGLYDSFASALYIFSLVIAFTSVLALMTYLSKSNHFRERLRK